MNENYFYKVIKACLSELKQNRLSELIWELDFCLLYKTYYL